MAAAGMPAITLDEAKAAVGPFKFHDLDPPAIENDPDGAISILDLPLTAGVTPGQE